MSNITVVTIEKPQPPNEEKGYKGRNSYKIVDENNVSYFAQPTLYNTEHLKEGDEITNDTIHNFLANYIECLNMEEDYHTDHEFYIKEINKPVNDESIWKMKDVKTGECK